VDAGRLAGAEDRHDVGVVQPGGVPRLPPEALQEMAPLCQACRQHLEGDVPAQRLLHRLVHHPHAALADGPHDAELAQLPWDGLVAAGRRAGIRHGGGRHAGAGRLHLDQGREQLPNAPG
jgi:hypothetical protein